MKEYEDYSDEIDELLEKSRGKWQLKAISWMCFDDVKQIIRAHIYKKWHLYDQKQPFGSWCRTVISNQISNLIRNHYSNFARPCLKCPYFMGEEECGWTKSGEQDASCEDYKKWLEKKKPAYDVKLPVSIEGQQYASEASLYENFDYEESSRKLHIKVKERLTNDRQREIYHMLYIDNATEKEVAERFGFKRDSKKIKRYKQIQNLRKTFTEIAKDVLEEEDILS